MPPNPPPPPAEEEGAAATAPAAGSGVRQQQEEGRGELPYHLFDSAETHPAVSVPAARTNEVRALLQPLLAARRQSESGASVGSTSSDAAAKKKGGRRRARQPYIITQPQPQSDAAGDEANGEEATKRRTPGRRLLVLRVDYDKDDADNGDDDGGDGGGNDGIGSQRESNRQRVREARRALAQLLEAGANSSKESADAVYLTTYDVKTDYKSLSAAQVLRRLLSHVALGGGPSEGGNGGVGGGEDGGADGGEDGSNGRHRARTDGPADDADDDAALDVPCRFEVAGHVAHVNLRDEWLPYKHWIGRVLLDKNSPAIKTVVNKVGTIENVYRVLDCEIIAGNSDPGWSLVTVKEEGCVFDLDFQKVYWNSRLAGEHHRLVKMLTAQAKAALAADAGPFVVADLMAGVGPFAVPLTRASQVRGQQRGKDSTSEEDAPNMVVHANDLNPDSYRFLVRNAQTNRCQNLHCYNQDARAFVHRVVEGLAPHAVIMNLPASAPEFLDAFRGFRASSSDGSSRLPHMYVHCFAPKEEEAKGYPSAAERCRAALGCDDLPGVTVRTVRNVSPRNNMVCVQFPLPPRARDLPKIRLGEGCDQLGRLPENAEADGVTQPKQKRTKTT